MNLDVTAGTLPEIKDPALRSYAERYVQIYADFMRQVQGMGVEIEAQDDGVRVRDRIETLRRKGANVRNDDKSVVLNALSPSCQACQVGVTSQTFFVSLKCHRDCFYCFNPNQEDYEYFREHTRDTVAELDELYSSNPRIKHLALTGGEPLLHKDEAYRFFAHAKERFPTAFTRLYTSGDHIDRQVLENLKTAGLDEIRFSIRMHDLARGQEHTYERIELAREYISNVMVEMPVLPGTLDEMKDILLRLDALGIFGINLLELCFPLNNADIFREKGYKIKARPFRVLYDYWYAGGLPVAGSETVCLDLVEFALQQGLKLGVHYCSLENKHTGQIYRQNSQHSRLPNMYFSQRDYFLKSAKVFGDTIAPVQRALEKAGYRGATHNLDLGYLEFPVERIKDLKKMDIEIGISSNVIETRGGERVVRELKVDVTTPQTFRQSLDV